jgi:hypothetical protein
LPKTKKLLDHLCKYRKKWHEPTGRYLDNPLHDIHSNAGDSWRYVCMAVSKLEKSIDSGGALEAHRKAVDNRRFRI